MKEENRSKGWNKCEIGIPPNELLSKIRKNLLHRQKTSLPTVSPSATPLSRSFVQSGEKADPAFKIKVIIVNKLWCLYSCRSLVKFCVEPWKEL